MHQTNPKTRKALGFCSMYIRTISIVVLTLVTIMPNLFKFQISGSPTNSSNVTLSSCFYKQNTSALLKRIFEINGDDHPNLKRSVFKEPETSEAIVEPITLPSIIGHRKPHFTHREETPKRHINEDRYFELKVQENKPNEVKYNQHSLINRLRPQRDLIEPTILTGSASGWTPINTRQPEETNHVNGSQVSRYTYRSLYDSQPLMHTKYIRNNEPKIVETIAMQPLNLSDFELFKPQKAQNYLYSNDLKPFEDFQKIFFLTARQPRPEDLIASAQSPQVDMVDLPRDIATQQLMQLLAFNSNIPPQSTTNFRRDPIQYSANIMPNIDSTSQVLDYQRALLNQQKLGPTYDVSNLVNLNNMLPELLPSTNPATKIINQVQNQPAEESQIAIDPNNVKNINKELHQMNQILVSPTLTDLRAKPSSQSQVVSLSPSDQALVSMLETMFKNVVANQMPQQVVSSNHMSSNGGQVPQSQTQNVQLPARVLPANYSNEQLIQFIPESLSQALKSNNSSSQVGYLLRPESSEIIPVRRVPGKKPKRAKVSKGRKGQRVQSGNKNRYEIDSPKDLTPSATFLKHKPWLFDDEDEEEGETEVNIRFFNNFSRMGPFAGIARSAGSATLVVSLVFLILSNFSLAATIIAHAVSNFLRNLSQPNEPGLGGLTSRLSKILHLDSTRRRNNSTKSITTSTTKKPTDLDTRIREIGKSWDPNESSLKQRRSCLFCFI